MKIIDILQGSPEWHAWRREKFTASDAPAMLGVSPHKTRGELLKEKATGITPEVDEATQARFDLGHALEDAARPQAEKEIGDELYPVVGEWEKNPRIAASFDGLTMDACTVWEHKTLNNGLRKLFDEDLPPLPDYLNAQIQQQILVANAKQALLSATHADGEILSRWVFADPVMRRRIIDGWAQFDKDLADYVLPENEPEVVAEAVQALPAVSVQVSGQIDVRENFRVFETALRDFLDNKLIRDPQTDQDFADLDLQIKAMKKAEEMLNAAESMMLAQIRSVDEAKRQKDMLAKMVRDNRIMAEKLMESEKSRRRAEKVEAARKAFAAHVAELQREIPGLRLDVPAPDFATAIKGLKTLASIQDKIDTALANGKIASDAQAADLRTKLAWVASNATDYRTLLPDLQQLAAKPLDDFKLAITARIDAHKAAEAKRLEEERERIRAEERARADAEAAAKLKSKDDAIVAPKAQVRPLNSSETPKMPLKQINERLAPISLSAEGLASLGYLHVATDKSAKLYYEQDFPRICAALKVHISMAEGRFLDGHGAKPANLKEVA